MKKQSSDVKTGKRLKMARKKLRIQLQEMACNLDVSASYLCDLEAGRRRWFVGLVEKYENNLRSL